MKSGREQEERRRGEERRREGEEEEKEEDEKREEKEEDEDEEDEEEATDIKSNNPHLAGGEKSVGSFRFSWSPDVTRHISFGTFVQQIPATCQEVDESDLSPLEYARYVSALLEEEGVFAER